MHDRPDQTPNQPHGGVLVQPIVDPHRAAVLRERSRDWPSWDLTPRQLCDLELLLNGGFSPLAGFMTRPDYDAVCQTMRLSSGLLWPLPITLDVPVAVATRLHPDAILALRDPEGVLLAAMHVEEVWEPDVRAEAETLFSTASPERPAVHTLLNQTHPCYVGGRVEGIQLPVHHDFNALRLTPVDVRRDLRNLEWSRVIAFAPRSIMHRAQVELTLRAARDLNAGLLVQASHGVTQPGDIYHYSRIRCYSAIMAQYPPRTALLTLSPLGTRTPGPRAALWQSIVAKNFGCTHWIADHEDAGMTANPDDDTMSDGHDVDEVLRRHEAELGITVVPSRRLACAVFRRHISDDEGCENSPVPRLSNAALRALLDSGGEVPTWFTFAEVADELRRTYPPRHQQGFTVFFTGLSGSGKSTLANALLVKLLEVGGRPVTLLDGDLVRKQLSSELGFSREHRRLNVLRIGYVASEVTKSRGIAICALIAPHEATRREVRRMIQPLGGFVLVHVATPLEVCEARDRKGLYAKARAGLLPEFTGISDPYETPVDADVIVNAATQSAAAAAQMVFGYLETAGYLALASEGRGVRRNLLNK
jgi:sulfate adenylyltransferase